MLAVFCSPTCVEGHVKNMRGGLSTQSAMALAKLCYDTLLDDGVDALRAVQMKVVTPALERLFLPFADDDPRTAEVVSKVLLLARDREIQDPTILEQIRR